MNRITAVALVAAGITLTALAGARGASADTYECEATGTAAIVKDDQGRIVRRIPEAQVCGFIFRYPTPAPPAPVIVVAPTPAVSARRTVTAPAQQQTQNQTTMVNVAAPAPAVTQPGQVFIAPPYCLIVDERPMSLGCFGTNARPDSGTRPEPAGITIRPPSTGDAGLR